MSKTTYSVTIATPNGPKRVKVPGGRMLTTHIGAHERRKTPGAEENARRGWIVDHGPTGQRVASLRTLADCRIVARGLEAAIGETLSSSDGPTVARELVYCGAREWLQTVERQSENREPITPWGVWLSQNPVAA